MPGHMLFRVIIAVSAPFFLGVFALSGPAGLIARILFFLTIMAMTMRGIGEAARPFDQKKQQSSGTGPGVLRYIVTIRLPARISSPASPCAHPAAGSH